MLNGPEPKTLATGCVELAAVVPAELLGAVSALTINAAAKKKTQFRNDARKISARHTPTAITTRKV